jgi:hypothetical protein
VPLTTDDDIRDLLENVRTIAVVGASDRPERDSYHVMRFLIDRGYDVIPVNPTISGEIHGRPVRGGLAEIDGPVDLVDIFRRSDAVDPIVDEAIAIGARAVWMQLGVVNHAAARRAEAAGLKVVMDRCPKQEIPRLGLARAA